MPKPPPTGRCIHCLKYYDELTWDHVIPSAWYPESTKDNIEKWKVPSCQRCNKEYGEIEEELLIKLGLCLDPKDHKSSGIAQKALRALNPKHGKNKKDQKIRLAKREKILKKSLFGKNIPLEGRYPGFDRVMGTRSNNSMAVLISPEHINRFAEKIVRGITYLDRQEFIDEPFVIDHIVLPEEGNEHIHELLDQHGSIIEREPGIYIKKAISPDDNMSSIFYIELWGRLKLYAFVTNKKCD